MFQTFHKYLSDPYNHDTIMTYQNHFGKELNRAFQDILKSTLSSALVYICCEVLRVNQLKQTINYKRKKENLLDTALYFPFLMPCISLNYTIF